MVNSSSRSSNCCSNRKEGIQNEEGARIAKQIQSDMKLRELNMNDNIHY
jgi:hypothetical protein